VDVLSREHLAVADDRIKRNMCLSMMVLITDNQL
jgi:hypothetical protein